MLSPVRYGQRKFRAGGTSGSIFSLIAATLGSGTISFAYIVMKLGYILGPLMIIIGAFISYYTGMLIVKSSQRTGRTRYEDIALVLYGQKVSRVVSGLNLTCLIGFTFSYITYIKKAVPQIVSQYAKNATAIKYFGQGEDGKSQVGEYIAALFFAYCILFPMSIPRNASALRFSSLFGVLCSIYLSLAVFCIFFSDRDIVPSTADNFREIKAFKFTINGFVNSTPLIIFAYMYQVNIPMIYVELEKRSATEMGKVLAYGSAVAVLFYVIVGIFGYATFAFDQGQLCTDKNILMAAGYRDSIPLEIGKFSLLFAIISAAPLCVLPSKDTIEELFYKENGMTKKANFLWTLALVTLNCALAVAIPNIGDAMTIVGSTINPVIGFILPVVFIWPAIKQEPWYGPAKVKALLTVAVIVIASIAAFVNFFKDQFSDTDTTDPTVC